MAPATIRPSHAADASALAGLCAQLGYQVAGEEIAHRVAALAGRSDRLVLVSEMDGDVVGWIDVQLRDSLVSGRYAEIDGLVVEAHRRGAGIGQALVDRACAWALERGANRMRVRSNVVRQRTMRFYEKLGFSLCKRQAVMDKAI